MASKKEAEGIALLSMYNDEEDEEMDDVDGGDKLQLGDEQGEKELQLGETEYMESSEREEEIRVSADRAAPASDSGSIGMPQLSVENVDGSPHLREEAVAVELRRRSRGRLTIVDYGHDEIAMSPEPEEGYIETSGQVKFGAKSSNGDYQEMMLSDSVQVISPSLRATPLSSEQQDQAQLGTPYQDSIESGASEAKHTIEGIGDIDPLDNFLPPLPTTKCSEELQERVRKFIAYKKAGKSFNAEVRNRKDYRNPDFLLHAVRYQDIDQVGSCFSVDVFDPHGYDPSDYCDEIEIDMKRESERKELERKKSQQVEFIPGGTHIANLAVAPKINMPVAVPNVAAGGLLRPPPAAPDAISREGRQNKKSKWDKVDTGGQDTISTVGAPALLSATNAGAGYTAFAQQRRREVEEKKSGERKSDRRT